MKLMCSNFPCGKPKNISVSPCLKGGRHLQKKAKKTKTELFKVWY